MWYDKDKMLSTELQWMECIKSHKSFDASSFSSLSRKSNMSSASANARCWTDIDIFDQIPGFQGWGVVIRVAVAQPDASHRVASCCTIQEGYSCYSCWSDASADLHRTASCSGPVEIVQKTTWSKTWRWQGNRGNISNTRHIMLPCHHGMPCFSFFCWRTSWPGTSVAASVAMASILYLGWPGMTWDDLDTWAPGAVSNIDRIRSDKGWRLSLCVGPQQSWPWHAMAMINLAESRQSSSVLPSQIGNQKQSWQMLTLEIKKKNFSWSFCFCGFNDLLRLNDDCRLQVSSFKNVQQSRHVFKTIIHCQRRHIATWPGSSNRRQWSGVDKAKSIREPKTGIISWTKLANSLQFVPERWWLGP